MLKKLQIEESVAAKHSNHSRIVYDVDNAEWVHIAYVDSQPFATFHIHQILSLLMHKTCSDGFIKAHKLKVVFILVVIIVDFTFFCFEVFDCHSVQLLQKLFLVLPVDSASEEKDGEQDYAGY